MVIGEPGAELLAERLLLGRERQVHRRLTLRAGPAHSFGSALVDADPPLVSALALPAFLPPSRAAVAEPPAADAVDPEREPVASSLDVAAAPAGLAVAARAPPPPAVQAILARSMSHPPAPPRARSSVPRQRSTRSVCRATVSTATWAVSPAWETVAVRRNSIDSSVLIVRRNAP